MRTVKAIKCLTASVYLILNACGHSAPPNSVGDGSWASEEYTGDLNPANFTDPDQYRDYIEQLEKDQEILSDKQKELYIEFFINKLTVWTNPNTGKRTFVKACREAPKGCEKRAAYIVSNIYDYASEKDLDVSMALSIAWHESRFNPFVKGPVGERGIFQINPKARWGKETRFVYDKNYRNKCKKKLGSCQKEVVHTALDLFSRCLVKCGNTFSALGLYNTGKCGGSSSYSKNVLKIYKEVNNYIEENS